MYKNIVIAGDVGTGTTTLAKSLAEELGWEFISSGDIFRAYTLKHNIPLWDHDAFPDEMDRQIDQQLVDKLKSNTKIVFDTHYGGWLAKDFSDVLKILLTCDPKIAEKRIISREHTHKETLSEIEKRRKGNLRKFNKLYSDENYLNPKFFDLVLDTTNTTPEKTFQEAIEFIRNKS